MCKTEQANRIRSTAYCAICALSIAVLTACGGGSGVGDGDPQGEVSLDGSIQSPENATIAADPSTAYPGTPEFTPSPGNGLPVLQQDALEPVSSSDDFIEAQWEHMQTCLLVSAQEPVVVVVEGKLEPIDSNDDVVRHIDGQIQASSHVTDTYATIQVRAQDLDGSLGSVGAHLRSIMGRYLWLANSLAERDYPYSCAKG